MEVIPAIDLKSGRCVRLIQGDFDKETIFSTDPGAVARGWEQAGAPRIHVVDLEGAASGRPENAEAVAHILESVEIPVQLGRRDAEHGNAGRVVGQSVQRVVLGTAVVEDPDFLQEALQRFGEGVIVGIDARDGRVAASGWKRTTEVDAIELIERMKGFGVRRIIYTDISRDGMLSGPNLESVRRVVSKTKVPVIASGGVSTIEHLTSLRELGVEGAIVGRALYTGDVNLREAIQTMD